MKSKKYFLVILNTLTTIIFIGCENSSPNVNDEIAKEQKIRGDQERIASELIGLLPPSLGTDFICNDSGIVLHILGFDSLRSEKKIIEEIEVYLSKRNIQIPVTIYTNRKFFVDKNGEVIETDFLILGRKWEWHDSIPEK